MSHADTIRRWFVGYPDAVPRDGDDALDALLAENQRLRDALEHYANPQHWGITRDGHEPVPTWIGTYRKPPTELAREALAGDGE